MVNARKDAIVVCIEVDGPTDPVIRWVPIVPGQADGAFAEALASLPALGGTLHVLPGSQPYVFQNTVLVDKPNVSMRFAAGPALAASSYLTFPATGGPLQLFKLRSHRFRCVGAYVKYSATSTSTDSGRSFFLVTDELGGADDAAFLGCTFAVKQDTPSQAPDITNFSCIRSEGLSDSAPRRGLRVSESSFLIDPGTAQSTSWSGADPLGICGVRATNTAEVLVTKTGFLGTNDVPPPRGAGGPMILLDNCPASILCDLVFVLISSIAGVGGEHGSLVRVTTHGTAEGHRTMLCRFLSENNDARYMVELIDARSDVLAFANFGRLLGHCEAGVVVHGAKSDGLVVAALNLHHVSAAPALSRLLDLQAIRNATVSGVTLKPFTSSQIPLRILNGTCLNVQVEADQAVAAP